MITNKNQKKYFEDLFNWKYITPIIMISILLIFQVSAIRSDDWQGAIAFRQTWFYFIYFIIISSVYIKFKRKVAVDHQGNISIPGMTMLNFKANRYARGKNEITYQFTKSNIKNVRLISYEEAKQSASRLEKSQLSKAPKIILFEFKTPLKQKSSFGFEKAKTIEKIYISLKEPEKLISHIEQSEFYNYVNTTPKIT